VFVLLVIGALLAYLLHHLDRQSAALVPVGIENAVVLRYGGPQLEVKPFKEGVSVNLRIAAIIERDNARIYDLRYIVNQNGEYDLRTFLQAADGQSVDDLPPIKVTGLSVGHVRTGESVEDDEPLKIEIWHYYYETLVALAALWLGCLLLLVFYRRSHQHAMQQIEAPTPAFAEIMHSFLTRLSAQTLTAQEKAGLEKLLFEHWCEALGLDDSDMLRAVQAIERSAEYGADYDALELWLHARHSDNAKLVAKILSRYAGEDMHREVAA
jgi:hypothetical protein